MAVRRVFRRPPHLPFALAASLALTSCGGGGSPPAPVAPTPEPLPPGATRVTGSERIAWQQPDEGIAVRFVLYVGGNAVPLDSAVCDMSQAQCSSPLPALADGLHTLSVAAIGVYTGLESERSDSITVQKVSARSVVSAMSSVDGAAGSAVPLVTTASAPDGRTFAIDVVARGLRGPVQLDALPDGRLLVAGGDDQVRIVDPGAQALAVPALDVPALLGAAPRGHPGVAVHPSFERNRFVYLAFVSEETPDQPVLRVVRLRELADTLGEPAELFSAPLTTRRPEARPSAAVESAPALASGAFAAFGPDGLLYVLLPAGTELADAAAASRPHASMLRLTDEGRLPEAGPIAGVAEHPLGFGWHPSSAALLGLVGGTTVAASVRELSSAPSAAAADAPLALRMATAPDASAAAYVLDGADPLWALGVARGLDRSSRGAFRLSVPIRIDGLLDGVTGRVADAVVRDGVWHLAFLDDAAGDERRSSIVRLRPQ